MSCIKLSTAKRLDLDGQRSGGGDFVLQAMGERIQVHLAENNLRWGYRDLVHVHEPGSANLEIEAKTPTTQIELQPLKLCRACTGRYQGVLGNLVNTCTNIWEQTDSLLAACWRQALHGRGDRKKDRASALRGTVCSVG